MSPKYTFTGAYPRVLTGLSEGVNARSLNKTPEPSYGSTVIAEPGDVIETDLPYEHPELDETAPEAPVEVPEAPAEAPAPVVEQPAEEPAPITEQPAAETPAEPAEEPAHTDMTAEGAPAPAAS